MTNNFLAYLPLIVSVVAAIAAYYSPQIQKIPSLKKVHDAYPLINVILKEAASLTGQSPYGFLIAAAAQIWDGQGLTQKEAAKLITASVIHFDRSKFRATMEQELDPHTLARGRELAEKVVKALEA